MRYKLVLRKFCFWTFEVLVGILFTRAMENKHIVFLSPGNMPDINGRGPKSPKKIPKSPEDRPISAGNCCSRCLYNIPRGSLMIVFPGLVILLMGAVIMSLTETSDAWSAGTGQLAMMLLIIGGLLTLGGLIFWTCMWCKYKPPQKAPSNRHHGGKRSVSPDTPVELVAVYHITNKKDEPAYQMSGPGPSGVIQVTWFVSQMAQDELWSMHLYLWLGVQLHLLVLFLGRSTYCFGFALVQMSIMLI